MYLAFAASFLKTGIFFAASGSFALVAVGTCAQAGSVLSAANVPITTARRVMRLCKGSFIFSMLSLLDGLSSSGSRRRRNHHASTSWKLVAVIAEGDEDISRLRFDSTDADGDR